MSIKKCLIFSCQTAMAELLEPSNNFVEFVHVEKDRYNSFREAVTLSESRGSGEDIAPCDIPAQFNNTFPRLID